MVIRCECLSPIMIDTHGEEAYLDLPAARELERKGHVKILGTMTNEPVGQYVKQIDDLQYLKRDAFAKGGGLKVAWVQDYHKDGGAEISNVTVVSVGTLLGFDIVAVTPENFSRSVLQEADAVVLNNMFEFTDPQFQEILRHIYLSKQPVVKYEHDHREITLRPQIAKRLFDRLDLSVFISPKQQEDHAVALENKLGKKSIVLPLAIDIKKFTNLRNQREEKSCLIPSAKKCAEQAKKFISENPDYHYTCIGADLGGIFLPEVDPEKMAELYNRFETVLHVPDKRGGGERVLFEAVLCGCKVVTNDNAYHKSWEKEWDWTDPSMLAFQLRKAPYAFWRAIRSLVK
jgi:hypothetical protein